MVKRLLRRMDNSSTKTDLIVLLLLSLVIRVTLSLLAEKNDPFLRLNPLHGDAGSYDRIARSLLNGTGFAEIPGRLTSFWPPLYPAFLAFIYSIGGYHHTVARVVQSVLGAFVPLMLYLAVYRPFGRNVARVTGLGLAMYPYLVYFGTWLIAESLFMFLLGMLLYAISIHAQSQKRWMLIPIGILFGLCVLCKPTTLFFLPFYAIWIYLASQKRKFPDRLQDVVLLTSMVLIMVLPWTARNYVVHGQVILVSTNGGYTLLGANNPNAWGGHDEGYPPAIPGLTEAQMEKAYYAEAISWIQSDPGGFIQLLMPKYRRLFSPLSVASYRQDYPVPGAQFIYALYSIYLLLALIGAVLSLKRWRQMGHFYALVLGVLLSAGLYYGDARYTIPMAPALVLFTAFALESIWLKITQWVQWHSPRASSPTP